VDEQVLILRIQGTDLMNFHFEIRTLLYVLFLTTGSSFTPGWNAHDASQWKLKSSTSLELGTMDIVLCFGVCLTGFAGWLYIDGTDDRERARRRQEEEARYEEYQSERAKRAYVESKDMWKEEELAEYDGTKNEDGPILFAADGLVFNVWKGRNFYGPGGEYHIFAGRDATRLLARTKVEEEIEEEKRKPLNLAERAALAGWVYTFKGKYEVVGKLENFDPSTTSM
jgi:membrane-associated progesterone receptor component